MIKKIKVKKELRLDELIKYIFENNEKDKTYRNLDNQKFLSVDRSGVIRFGYGVDSRDTFTVEVEEEITEDTRMAKIVILTKDGVIHRSWNDSINGLKIAYPDALQIHAIVNGKLELIYERSENL